MTISSSNRKAGPFTGNGITTSFPFTFKVFQASDLYVVLADTSSGVELVQALTTNYTVSLNADQNTTPGGSVVMLTAPASGFTLTLTSAIPQTQAVDLQNNGGFYPAVINAALDKITILIQQVTERVDRALLSAVSSVTHAKLPAPAATKVLAWNAAGTDLENVDMIAGQSALATALAAPTGSSLVGFIQSGTGAVATTVQAKLRESVSVKDFGAVGDGVTDDHAAIQAALASLTTGVTLNLPFGTYNIGTVGITIPYHNIVINGNNSTLLYSGSQHAFDAALVGGTIYPQGIVVNDLAVQCSATCLSAIRFRFSYSQFKNVYGIVTASNSTAWRIDTDFTNGTGPYYNQFSNCHAGGKVGIIGGVVNQTGWLFTTSASAPTRGPNANTFLPGRTSDCTNGWVIAGSQNRIIGPTIEGTPSGGQVVNFENVYGGGAGCFTNLFTDAYVEGNSGANFAKFGTNSNYNAIVRPMITSLGAGVYLNDASGVYTNTIQDSYGTSLSNTASTNPRQLDWYEEGSFTPAVEGQSVAGTNTYAIQVGRFQRVGNRVHIQISLLMTAKDAAMAGNIKITGLPYAAATGVANNLAGMPVSDWYLSLDAGYTQVGARIDAGQFLWLMQLGSNKSPALLTKLNIYATTELYISGSYEV